MSLIKRWSIATLTAALVRQYARSLPDVESLVCARCGLSIVARHVAGTLSSTYAIDCNPPKRSHFKVSLALTVAGNLSISCGCSQLGEHLSHHGSGVVAGTSFLPENSAKPCGCDPGVNHTCEEHTP